MNNSNNDDERLVYETLLTLGRLYFRFLKCYKTISLVLVCFGCAGSSLGFATLLYSGRMKTVSYLYHKTLMLACFVYCANALLLKIVDFTLLIQKRDSIDNMFRAFLPAFYSGILSRVITSWCGYVSLYMTICITLDRCVALCLPFKYSGFSRAKVAYGLIGGAILMSTAAHSWFTWFERRVVLKQMANETSLYIWTPSDNEAIPRSVIVAKGSFNATVRVAYAILVTLMTVLVCHKFRLQKKHQRHLMSKRTNKHMERRGRSLFTLMINVVILAYITVLPREAKRVLGLLYPEQWLANMTSFTNRNQLSLDERLRYMYIFMCGHKIMQLVVNLCTCVERSIIFYMYFALNQQMRKETIRFCRLMLGKLCRGLLPESWAIAVSNNPTPTAFPTNSKPRGSPYSERTQPRSPTIVNGAEMEMNHASTTVKVETLNQPHLHYDQNLITVSVEVVL